MNQLTLRGFDRDLERRLREVARQRQISLNKAAILLLRRGAGLEPEEAAATDVIGDSLDHLIGSWTAAEAQEFDDAVAAFEQVDDEMWR